jgi:thiamine pyrophosphokinase
VEGFYLSNQRAFVFANGILHATDWLKKELTAADLLIAADGGLKHLQSLDFSPYLLIGDLDSVTPDQVDWAKARGSQVDRYPIAKDQTDLELALMAAKKMNVDEIIIVAGLGGRLDQTLGNLSLLRLPELRDCSLRFDDGLEEVFIIRGQAKLHGQPGDTLYLLPLWGQVDGVVTEGLAYPLVNETLYSEHTRGISNVMSLPLARVSVSAGELLCVHTHNPLSIKEE